MNTREELIKNVPIIAEIGCPWNLDYNYGDFFNTIGESQLYTTSFKEMRHMLWHAWNKQAMKKRLEYNCLFLRKELSNSNDNFMYQVIGILNVAKGNSKSISMDFEDENHDPILDKMIGHGATHVVLARNNLSAINLHFTEYDIYIHKQITTLLQSYEPQKAEKDFFVSNTKRYNLIDSLILTPRIDEYKSILESRKKF